jgi:hypothetical protein
MEMNWAKSIWRWLLWRSKFRVYKCILKIW